MIIEYAEIQKYNSDLHFKSIKESINNQIIEMKNKKVAQQFSKWAIFLAMTAGGKDRYMGVFANETHKFIFNLIDSWNKNIYYYNKYEIGALSYFLLTIQNYKENNIKKYQKVIKEKVPVMFINNVITLWNIIDDFYNKINDFRNQYINSCIRFIKWGIDIENTNSINPNYIDKNYWTSLDNRIIVNKITGRIIEILERL